MDRESGSVVPLLHPVSPGFAFTRRVFFFGTGSRRKMVLELLENPRREHIMRACFDTLCLRTWTPILAFVSVVLIGWVDSSSGQMFGSRRLGGGVSGPQQDLGSVRNQRFLRRSRGRQMFIGRDASTRFVGSEQARAGTARSAVSGLSNRDASAQINRPLSLPSASQSYIPQVAVDFGYEPVSPKTVAADVTASVGFLSDSISVSVVGRTAILRGEVASEEDRRLAEILARFEPAISAVQNDLTIAAGREAR